MNITIFDQFLRHDNYANNDRYSGKYYDKPLYKPSNYISSSHEEYLPPKDKPIEEARYPIDDVANHAAYLERLKVRRERNKAKKERKAQRASEPPKKLTEWDILCKKTLEVLKTIPKSDRKGVTSHLKIASELRKVQIVDPTLNDVKAAIYRVAGVTSAQEEVEELTAKTSMLMKDIPSDEKLNVKEPTMKIVKASVNTLIGTNTKKINESRITGISYDEEDSLDRKQTTKYQPLEDSTHSAKKNKGILKSIKKAFKSLLKKED